MSAQDQGGTYDQALAELRRGRKVSHWMWFVFPQIAGLGFSATSRHFAISSLAEAEAYLEHPVLGPRLLECARVRGRDRGPNGRGRSSVGIDAQKLRSSMTLFSRAAPDEAVFRQVLDRFFDGESDPATDQRLGR